MCFTIESEELQVSSILRDREEGGEGRDLPIMGYMQCMTFNGVAECNFSHKLTDNDVGRLETHTNITCNFVDV